MLEDILIFLFTFVIVFLFLFALLVIRRIRRMRRRIAETQRIRRNRLGGDPMPKEAHERIKKKLLEENERLKKEKEKNKKKDE